MKSNPFLYNARYRAKVLKVASPKEINVLYIDFGNVSMLVVMGSTNAVIPFYAIT